MKQLGSAISDVRDVVRRHGIAAVLAALVDAADACESAQARNREDWCTAARALRAAGRSIDCAESDEDGAWLMSLALEALTEEK